MMEDGSAVNRKYRSPYIPVSTPISPNSHPSIRQQVLHYLHPNSCTPLSFQLPNSPHSSQSSPGPFPPPSHPTEPPSQNTAIPSIAPGQSLHAIGAGIRSAINRFSASDVGCIYNLWLNEKKAEFGTPLNSQDVCRYLSLE